MIRKKLESKEPGCLLIIDIDHFKQFNDNYGHIYGDEVLFKVAKGLRESFRKEDIVGRFGGDEFIAFMHKAKVEDAKNKAELYRSRLKTLFEGKAPVTCSIGIAASDECSNYENLLKQADEALYYAKENGRNQVCVYNKKEEKS
jgi:diguanylate cyclase (GGDEF)-like protein